jgi:hypothetical protein
MSKILLVEPQKILRQAISLALFQQHDVQVEKSLEASQLASLNDYDLLIIDGAALREGKQLNAEITCAIQGCKTPTLWLEEVGASQAPKREKLLVVRKPIEREPFQSAVEGFLSGETSPKKGARPSSPVLGAKPAGLKRETRKAGASPEQGSFGFIDLVDVVEENASPRQEKKPAKKSK